MAFEEPDSIGVSGELDKEENSPYLRRQKAVTVRRSRISRRWRWALFIAGVLVPAGCAGYLLATLALSSPHFELKSAEDVVVEGNRFVSRAEILNVLGLPFGRKAGAGRSLLRLSLETARKQVESIPWVHRADLMRVYPHGLLIRVVEREPIAFVNIGGHVGLVDEEGILLEKPENAAFDFPVLTGLDASGNMEERRSRLALYQEFMREVSADITRSGWLISEIDLRDAEDLRVLLVQQQETLQVHFGHQEFAERFRNLVVLLPELRRSNTRLDSVDLRFHNQVVVNPEPPAAKAQPAAAPSPETSKD